MPETPTTTNVRNKNKLRSTAPWVWLFEVQLDSTRSIAVAMWDANVVSNGITYLAFPVLVGSQSRSEANELPTLTITISNLSSEVISELEQSNLMDQRVIIRLVNEDDLDNPIHVTRSRVIDAVVDARAAQLTLGQYELFDQPFPTQRFSRTRCRWTYGDPATCGYDRTRSGALATCALTLDDCKLHGDDEENAGLPRLHPLRFGAYPGIPRGSSRT